GGRQRALALLGQELGEGRQRELVAGHPEAGRERLVREDDTPLRVEEPHSLSEALQERALHALTVSEGLLALLAGLDLTAQLGAQRKRTATRVHDQPEPAREHELHKQRDGARGPPGLGARRGPERVA